jgi:cytoskeletal protein RodZ
MTVATEACYAERQYTGVEMLFSPGFSALAAADVQVGYFGANTLPVLLTQGTHFSATLAPDGSVTVTRIAFPSASVAAPVTIFITRKTPAIQGTDFDNLGQFDPAVHERIADAGAMRDAELRSLFARNQQPFNATSATADFRPRTVKAADPTAPEDLATKAYADQVSGSTAAASAAASAAAALASQTASGASATTASNAAASAIAAAAILGSPDDGLLSDSVGSTIDDGTLP